MPGMNGAGGQGARQHLDQIGAVHPEGRVPARGVRHLDRRNRRSVMAEIAGIRTHAGAPFLHRRSQSDPLQMPHAVGGQKHAGADLADLRRLLVDRDPQTLCQQRIGREQASDSASDDRDIKTGLHHGTPITSG